MGVKSVISVLIISVLLAIVYQKFHNITKSHKVPKLNQNAFWGIGDEKSYVEDTKIRSKKIHYDISVIDKLRAKLNETLWLPDPLEGVRYEYGINSKELVEFVDYWRDDYLPRWSTREDYINSLPHFTTNIQGLEMHFLHVKPTSTKGKTVIPLLLLHGWPGSVREFYDFIPLLTAPNANSNYVFEVIAPSLPGYGWSQGSAKQLFGPAEISVVLKNLMERIGHTKFAIQGGDWGSIIGATVATLYPDNVIAYHSNFCTINTPLSNIKWLVSSFWPSLFIDKQYESFVYPVGEKVAQIIEFSGYFHIQATKPDTIGTALLTSPVGLLAYIQEKFIGAYPEYNPDALLDNIMIYYLTNSMTTAVRLYAEALTSHQRKYELSRVPTNVPTACARFRYDISHHTDWQLKDKFVNLIQSTWYLNGGHFAAMEVPIVLYEDFVKFISKVQSKGR